MNQIIYYRSYLHGLILEYINKSGSGILKLVLGSCKLVLGFIKFKFGLHKVRGDIIDGPQRRILKICKFRGERRGEYESVRGVVRVALKYLHKCDC